MVSVRLRAAGRVAAFPALIGFFSVLVGFQLVGLDVARWRAPLQYERDAFLTMMVVKTGSERPWFTGSDRLGAPGTLDLAHYPAADDGQLAVLKVLSLVGFATPWSAVNAYYLLTFFLAGASAAWALRRLGLSRGASAVGALTFALLPGHFYRGTEHLFVAGYYFVPVQCVALLQTGPDSRRSRWAFLAVCLVSPLMSVYYSYFFALVLAPLAVLDATHTRRWGPCLRAAQGYVAMAAGMVIHLARSLPMAADGTLGFVRKASDTEVFGLKITQLILPALATLSTHLNNANALYNATAPEVNENRWADLGLLGALAFLATLAITFLLAGRTGPLTRARDAIGLRAGLAVVICILFATIGGFSSLLSYTVTPVIRSTNRISVFIAFLSLTAVGMFVESRIPVGWVAGKGRRWLMGACVVLIGVLLWDLKQKPFPQDFPSSTSLFAEDTVFFAQLEAAVPAGARIYQLPYVPFPEGDMDAFDYSEGRAYLHTYALAWSFGSVRRTPEAQANEAAAKALMGGRVQAFVDYVHSRGFAGVLLSRDVAAYGQKDYESILKATFGAPTLTSQDFAWFPVPVN